MGGFWPRAKEWLLPISKEDAGQAAQWCDSTGVESCGCGEGASTARPAHGASRGIGLSANGTLTWDGQPAAVGFGMPVKQGGLSGLTQQHHSGG